MSKKNNNNQHLKQRIREQQGEINRLRRANQDYLDVLREMRENSLKTYADVMLVIFESFMMEDLTDELAGQLMLSLTDVMLYNNV
ncbi:MAG: hypothetical protein J6A48_01570 [Clostridia bacterium]|nr:hypothetical protein [Clostridia bacterium]